MDPGVPPPLAWSGRGSRAAALLAGAVAGAAGPLRAAGRALDALAAPLSARPLLWTALAPVGVPLARLLLPGAAGGAAAILLAGAAGVSLLLRAAAALHRDREAVLVGRALLAGLLLRVAAGVLLASLGGLPDEAGSYDPFARSAAGDWAAGRPSLLADHPLASGRWTYFALLSGTYLLVGASVAAGRLLGILVGLGNALLAGEVARPLGGARAAALAVAVLSLHPEHALWSATLSRDGVSTFLVLATLALAARGEGRLLRGRVLLLAGPLLLLACNSLPPAAALGGAVLILILVEAARDLRSGAAGALRAAAVVAGVAGAAILARGLLPEEGILDRLGLLRSDVLRADLEPLHRAGRLTSDLLPGFRPEGAFDLLVLVLAGIPFVLFAPWPWTAVHGLRAAYAGVSLVGAAAAVLGVVGLGAALRRAPLRALGPAAFAALMLLALAVLEGNAGILARHRLPLTAVLAAGCGVLLAGRVRED